MFLRTRSLQYFFHMAFLFYLGWGNYKCKYRSGCWRSSYLAKSQCTAGAVLIKSHFEEFMLLRSWFEQLEDLNHSMEDCVASLKTGAKNSLTWIMLIDWLKKKSIRAMCNGKTIKFSRIRFESLYIFSFYPHNINYRYLQNIIWTTDSIYHFQ